MGALDSWCARQPCPASIEEVTTQCEFAQVERYATICGGTLLEVSEGFSSVLWYFDEHGTLVGASYRSDTAIASCPGGGDEMTYGTTCVRGMWIDRPCESKPRPTPCEAMLTAPPVECGADEPCPGTLAVFATVCCGAQGGSCTANGCGGTIVNVDNPGSSGTLGYCYDSEKRLIGISFTPENGGDTTFRGAICFPDGPAQCPL
jgi:hypothetical protein